VGAAPLVAAAAGKFGKRRAFFLCRLKATVPFATSK
jgi:hypothetical protein